MERKVDPAAQLKALIGIRSDFNADDVELTAVDARAVASMFDRARRRAEKPNKFVPVPRTRPSRGVASRQF